MIKVVDRVPTYPNRVKITKEDGTSEYVTWERADEPTVAGTPINKALFDSIAADMGLSANTTIYVSNAGSDTLGDGTAASPYATIQKAIDSLPPNLNGFDATINIATGTYDEDVEIARFSCGNIILTGTAGAAVSMNSLRVSFGSMVQVTNIALSLIGSIDDCSLAITNASLSCSSQITISNGTRNGVYLNTNALCYFELLAINNSTEMAVRATNNSSAYIASLSGSNNTGIGIRCIAGAQVTYNTSTLTASVTNLTGSGGRIYSGSQTSIPNY